MDTTQTESRYGDASPHVWWLVVVHHPDLACVGRRLAIEGELALGRATPMLSAREDVRMSRTHARLRIGPDGPIICDAKSRNGTTVGGGRITERALLDGDVIGIGSVLLLARRAPASVVPRPHPRVAHESHVLAELLDELSSSAPRGAPAWLWGETGTGKGLLAEEIHLRSGRAGAFVSARCASISEENVAALLDGDGAREGLLSQARGGTLYLDGLEDASPALQAALIPRVDALRGVGVIASSIGSPVALREAGRVRPDLVGRFAGWAFEVPPLRRRREDVAAIIARHFVAVAPTRPSLALSHALLCAPLHGNVRELTSLLERASLDAQEGEVPCSPSLRAAMAGEPSAEPAAARAAGESALLLHDGGAWLERIGGGRVSLATRKTLRRLLAALVRVRRLDAERSLSVADLLAEGWPGELVLPRAGASRVYVAMATLRQLGLLGALERTPTGYRLAPGADIRLVAG
jgi:hypothetical protein